MQLDTVGSGTNYRFFTYFVLRNDSYYSDIVVIEPTKTNQAYNRYGGESLYYTAHNDPGRSVRAYQVSFDRPYDSGAGTGVLFTHDMEMVRWLEASSYDVNLYQRRGPAVDPNILLHHAVMLDEGHDEYWTWEERDNVELAIQAGAHMIFLSGNESYWRIRLENSGLGPNRIITCYKDAALDPMPNRDRQDRHL